jgi:hypothetical protein
MGNYSKNPKAALKEALEKGYDRVRFQQGKPILDRELNLLGDLSSTQRLAPYIGNGVPTGGKKGGLMALEPSDPKYVDFELMPGRAIVGGLEVVISDVTSYVKQPHQENVKNSWPSAGFKGAPGYVYLRVFLTEVDDTDDTDLQNQDDIGFETTLREKVDWELLLSATLINSPDHLLLADYVVISGGIAENWRDRRVMGLTLETLRTDFEEFRGDVMTKTAMLNPKGDLAPDSVGTTNIQDNAVVSTKLQDGAVTKNKLAPLAVTNASLADNSVGTTKLQDNSVNNNKLAANSVGTTQLQENSVNADRIAASAVNSTKLAPNSVVYGKIAANSITVAQFKFLSIVNTSFSMNAAAVTTIVILPKPFVGPENFLVYNVWSDNDLSWSELMVNGNRLLKITNTSGVTITVNVVARLVFVN